MQLLKYHRDPIHTAHIQAGSGGTLLNTLQLFHQALHDLGLCAAACCPEPTLSITVLSVIVTMFALSNLPWSVLYEGSVLSVCYTNQPWSLVDVLAR